MSSSPIAPADASSTRHERLLAVLDTVPDPRDPRGVRYPLAGVLTLAVTATLAGARSFAAIGQWAADTTLDHLAAFGLTRAGAPDESTLRCSLPVWMRTRSIPLWGGGCGHEPGSATRGG